MVRENVIDGSVINIWGNKDENYELRWIVESVMVYMGFFKLDFKIIVICFVLRVEV